ncbi:TonB family protein [Mucilaginibacter sp. JRF]|uniref:TonB family protein n=1 Tax=Mucilaginibacter sp. JRF TaxID=2780088 RepID=UPI00187F8A83|nr:TonB family protein [Mucilaginibacter sp. JRF]
MSKPTDIAKQIEKYLNGELDARAMHQLEREAQNDPFLMDALEGYGKAGGNQQVNLDDITGRLQQRTAIGKVRSMLMWRLTAAASVIVVLGAIGLWFYTDKPKLNENELAKQVEIVKPSGVVGSSATPEKKDSALQETAKMDTFSPSPYMASAKKPKAKLRKKKYRPATELAFDPNSVPIDTAIRKGASLDEIIVMGYATQKRETVTGSVATITSDIIKRKTIIGKVTDDLKQPLPGVDVKVKDKNIGTQTDANGNFTLTVPEKSTVNFGYVGFESKDVKVKDQDSLMIAMIPNQNALNEVVVVTKSKIIKGAHPANGWDEFNQYLKENAISPDGKEGTVKLSFIVDEDGSLTDFEITKSLSDETDQQAIALIKDGPKWVSDVSEKPKKIKLSIKFKAE